MNTQLVEIYLDAENDIKNNNYVEAFRKYESILFEEPADAPTHNSLGWIYKTQMDDYVNAEGHYIAAISGNPSYPHSYYNYGILLMDMERFEDLEKLIQKGMEIDSVDKSWLYHRSGLVAELKIRFEEAISFYEKAILFTLSDDKIKNYNEDITRCTSKLELSHKYVNWLKQ
ncbi:MAG TPA: tetratricopeptide repeat protein [Flavisolibacter sp.]|nr:tetratricopeptide repeat protein [Flavisolibacter sp.]